MTKNPFTQLILDIKYLEKTGKLRYIEYTPSFARDIEIEVVEDTSKPLRKRSQAKRYGPNPGTQRKLERLINLKNETNERLRTDGVAPIGWVGACRQAEIDPKTAKRWLPKLHAHWDDKSYVADWENWEYWENFDQ